MLGILAALAVPTYDAVREASVKRTVESIAQAIARDANAISAVDGSGGVTTYEDVNTAAGEVTFTPGQSSWTAGTGNTNGTGGVVTVESGSIECTVEITTLVADEQAIAEAAAGDCA